MVDIHWLAILVATVVQFIIGAIWYMPLFGKLWGDIHGFDQHSPEAQAAMRKGMPPLLATQFVMTFITTFVFDLLLNGFPYDWNIFGLAAFYWLGFVMPTQVAGVIFGGTRPGWILKKIAVMAGGSLVCLEALALVFKLMV